MTKLNTTGSSNEEVILELSRTKEFRLLASSILPELLNQWSANDPFRKIIANPLASDIKKAMGGSKLEGSPLLEEKFPDLINKIVNQKREELEKNKVNTDDDTISFKPEFIDEKQEKIKSRSHAINLNNIVNLFNDKLSLLNSINKKDTDFFPGLLTNGFQSFIENTDFSDFKDILKSGSKLVGKSVRNMNTLLWDYPAKIILSISLLPDFANEGMKTGRELLKSFNVLSPDILSDILLSLMREFDSKTAASVTNEISELIHKIHTGSALLGDPGTPLFGMNVRKKISEFLQNLDASLYWKARVELLNGKDSFKAGIISSLEEDSKWMKGRIGYLLESFNISLRSKKRVLEFIADQNEEQCISYLEKTIGELDIQESAEVLNLSAMLVNRIREINPDAGSELVSRFVSTLDSYEVIDALGWLTQEISKALDEERIEELAPIGRSLLAPGIRALSSWLEVQDDDYQEDIDNAMKQLKSVLNLQGDK